MLSMQYQKNMEFIDQNIVSIEDRAFLYGDGCFSTARLKQGELILWERHLNRLQRALQSLRLNCDIDRIKKEKDVFLQRLPLQSSGIVKIILSRGVGQRGYAMPQQTCDLYFAFYPLTTNEMHPGILSKVGVIAEPLGTTMPCLRGIKSLNRLEQVMLREMARQQQWSEALCFDLQQHVVEGISSNCFLYLDGLWVTPDLALCGIHGTMRLEILERMKHYQIPHQIRIISHAEIAQIQAAFLCNALHPMQMIDQLHIDDQISQSLDMLKCRELFKILRLDELV